MESVQELIMDIFETTHENVVKNDTEYKNLENTKNEIINYFKSKMSDGDYQQLEKLIDCFDGQNFITAMGFCYINFLDLEKFLGEKV